jgi:DNA-binding CsgD family transcriptional regulator
MRRGRPRYPEVLTPREQQVLALLREGLTNADIAIRLGISPDGAKYHVSEILSKLGVTSRQDAVAWAERLERGPRVRLPGLLVFPRRYVVKLGAGLGATATLMVIALIVLSFFKPDSNEVRPELGKIAFVVEGNVWVKELPNGTLRQLTNDGTAWFPRWSASGKWLSQGLVAGTQISGRVRFDLDVISFDGRTQRYAPGCGYWSPTEDVLLCWGGSSVRVEAPEGTMLSRFDAAPIVRGLKGIAQPDIGGCSWSADSARIVCFVYETINHLDPASQYAALWSFRRDGSEPLELFANDAWAPGGGYVTVVGVKRDASSRDGTTVTFSLFSPIDCTRCRPEAWTFYEVSPSGGPVHKLDGTYMLTNAGQVNGGWANNGATGLLTEGGGLPTWTNKRIVLVDEPGSLRYLTEPQFASLAPTWGPGAKQIVFVQGPDIGNASDGSAAARDAVAQRRLWLMDADGEHKRRITSDDAYRDERPYFSRTEPVVLFGRIDREGGASLWLLDITDGTPQRLANLTRPAPTSRLILSYTREEYFKLYWDSYGVIPWQFMYSWWQPKIEAAQ